MTDSPQDSGPRESEDVPKAGGNEPQWKRGAQRVPAEHPGDEDSGLDVPAIDQTMIDPASGVDAGALADEEDLVGEGTLIQSSAATPAPGTLQGPKIQDVSLLREIGRGGMGVVYEGRQGYLDRAVAVKVLTHAGGGEEFTMRFQREAKILASLSHPNIVACYQAGISEDGHGYLVMEFVDGPTLGDWIDQDAPLRPERAVAVCRDIARALECAYRSGIIHRDVKPPNVLLKRIPDGDPDFPFQPLLADLGLARASGEFSGSSGVAIEELTIQGTVMGSPPTMAPEQFDDPESVDFRTDIYGLGCVLYHCLTGKLAFPQGSLTSLIARKTHEAPPDPSELQNGIPRGIATLVRDMLRPNANERPSSYEELLARMEGPFEEGPRLPVRKKSPVPLILVAIILLAGAGLLAVQFLGSSETPAQEEPVVAQLNGESNKKPAEDAPIEDPTLGDDPEPEDPNPQPSGDDPDSAGVRGDSTESTDNAQAVESSDVDPDEPENSPPPVEVPEPARLELPELDSIAQGQVLQLLGQEFGASPLSSWVTELGDAEAWSALDEGHGAQALVFEGKSAASIALPAPPWQLTGSFELKRPGGRSEPSFALALLLEKGTGLALRQKRDGEEISFLGERVERQEAGGFEAVDRLFDLTLSSSSLEEYRAVAPLSFRMVWDGEVLTISWRLASGEERVESMEAVELIPWGAPVAFGLQLESGAALLRDLVLVGG